MVPLFAAACLARALPITGGSLVPLVDFKGDDPSTTHKWQAMNDPVMGGQSYSTVAVQNGVLNFKEIRGALLTLGKEQPEVLEDAHETVKLLRGYGEGA